MQDQMCEEIHAINMHVITIGIDTHNRYSKTKSTKFSTDAWATPVRVLKNDNSY